MNEHQIPHDTTLEKHLIGAMLYDPICIVDVVDIVKPRFFYHNGYKNLYESIFALWKEDEKKVTFQGLAPAIEKSGIPVSDIVEAMRSIATVADIRHNAQRLKDIAALRAAVKVGQELVGNGYLKEGAEIREAISKAETTLSKITDANVQTETMRPIKDILMDHYEHTEKLFRNADASGITGLASGYKDLDNITSGFQKSDLIIIAARPSVGKTALALEIAVNIGLETQEAVAFFSLEMASRPLASRMVSSRALIDSQKLRSGLLVDDDWEKYTFGISELSVANLMIDEQPGMTVAEMKAKCRKLKREQGLACIFIDYLGLIKGDNSNRYELVSENTRELKNLAREFNVPVICLCQLKRDVEARSDKRPMMSDLRESGEIEQSADVIAFLYRDDYYNAESEKKNIIEIIISKQRNGPVGTVELAFLKNYNKFMSLDRGHHQVTTLPPKSNTNNRRQWAK